VADPAKSTTLSDESILRQLHADYTLVQTVEGDLRARMLADWKFVDEDGGQWTTTAKQDRVGRPTLQIDRTTGPIRQVLNQIREARPAILVHPVDNGADPEKAEVRQGVIRRIETDSFADVAYLTAAEHQLKMGRGFWHLRTEWDEDQPYQHICIEPIDNPLSVGYDPRCRLPDGSDARFAMLREEMEREDYTARFGAEPPSSSEIVALGGSLDWGGRAKIALAEYYRVTLTYETIEQPDGTTSTRPKRTVTWYLTNGATILERRTIVGPYIPVIPVLGERSLIDGTLDLKGMVRRARDPQRMINHLSSSAVELMALGSKQAQVVDPRAIAAYKKFWDTRNTQNWAYLPMDSYDEQGRPYPRPQGLAADMGALQAYVMLSQQFENHHRATTGFFDVQGQELKPEQSGKAMAFRANQAAQGNSHFLDNLSRGVRLSALVLNRWIPVYFDTPRQLEIVGKTNQPRSVLVHAGNGALPPTAAQMAPEDVVDLRIGRYDITVSMGPSLQSNRQEMQERMGQLFTAAPQLLPIIGDLYFDALDWPDAHAIAQRLKKMLPPPLQDQPEGQAPIPPQVQQQMQQMGQHLADLTQKLQAAEQALQADQAKQQAQITIKQAELAQARELAQQDARIELEKAQIAADTRLAVAQLEAQTKRDLAALEATVDLQRAEQVRQTEPVEA